MRTVLALMIFTGCSASELCSDCPAVEGHYELAYQAISSQSPECTAMPPPAGPSAIELTRNGAQLHATLNGLNANGQLTQTSDFALTATAALPGDAGDNQTLTLRGFFITGAGADAGTGTLQGNWITHTERSSKSCDAQQPFTGTRR
jgi:hypothetical protein